MNCYYSYERLVFNHKLLVIKQELNFVALKQLLTAVDLSSGIKNENTETELELKQNYRGNRCVQKIYNCGVNEIVVLICFL